MTVKDKVCVCKDIAPFFESIGEVCFIGADFFPYPVGVQFSFGKEFYKYEEIKNL